MRFVQQGHPSCQPCLNSSTRKGYKDGRDSAFILVLRFGTNGL